MKMMKKMREKKTLVSFLSCIRSYFLIQWIMYVGKNIDRQKIKTKETKNKRKNEGYKSKNKKIMMKIIFETRKSERSSVIVWLLIPLLMQWKILNRITHTHTYKEHIDNKTIAFEKHQKWREENKKKNKIETNIQKQHWSFVIKSMHAYSAQKNHEKGIRENKIKSTSRMWRWTHIKKSWIFKEVVKEEQSRAERKK